jgi:methylphosphotriester-DNA--protein-cysteine methyltransferase
MVNTLEAAVQAKKARVEKLRKLLEQHPPEKACAILAVEEGVSIYTARRYLQELRLAGIVPETEG